MWGDNRDSSNANRFLVELIKMKTAQYLGIPTVLLLSSPGPIDDMAMRRICKPVYENFSLVVNREPLSRDLFDSYGYDVENTFSRACPAFLFSKEYYPDAVDNNALLSKEGIPGDEKLTGFIVTTNSLQGGSFSDWERSDDDFIYLAELVEYAINERGENVVIFSHSDGFVREPEFKRVPWRDYKMGEQLYELLLKRGIADSKKLFRIKGIYQPWEIHRFIGGLDKLISGKLHGAVAGMEQYIPTLPIDFQNGPISHKMQGMFTMINVQQYIVPRGEKKLIPYYKKVCEEADMIRATLKESIPKMQAMAIDAFDMLPKLCED